MTRAADLLDTDPLARADLIEAKAQTIRVMLRTAAPRSEITAKLAELRAEVAQLEAELTEPAPGLTVYLIAKDAESDTGRRFTAYHVHQQHWTEEPAQAAATADREQAQTDADDWNSYWASKGYDQRAYVAPFTTAELDAT